jgi:hypothetical protein
MNFMKANTLIVSLWTGLGLSAVQLWQAEGGKKLHSGTGVFQDCFGRFKDEAPSQISCFT